MSILSQYTKTIQHRLRISLSNFISQKQKNLGSVNSYGSDVLRRYAKFLLRGKLLRSVLVYIGYDLFSPKKIFDVSGIALACEFFQSAILIHDDFMDHDDMRRGEPSIPKQYQIYAAGKSNDPVHMGNSLAVCAGDIGFFLGFEILSTLHIECRIKSRISQLYSQTLSEVSVAQMADIAFAATRHIPTSNEIVKLYMYKTGRYSSGLPLAAGAIAAHAPTSYVKKLWELGESIGILFQLKDDELGILGDTGKTGKPVGSDVREKKKTLYISLLMSRVHTDEKSKLLSLFGKKDVTQKEISFIKAMLKKYTITKDITVMMKQYKKKAMEIVKTLEGDAKIKILLQDLISYVYTRER